MTNQTENLPCADLSNAEVGDVLHRPTPHETIKQAIEALENLISKANEARLFKGYGNGPLSDYATEVFIRDAVKARSDLRALLDVQMVSAEEWMHRWHSNIEPHVDFLIERVQANAVAATLAKTESAWMDDMSKAPQDNTPHYRGLFINDNGVENCFRSYEGCIDDETGEFVSLDGDYIGWDVSDFTHWKLRDEPLPPIAATLAGKDAK